MEDVREVREELHRLVETEALDPFDTTALLARGRRGRRRRTVLTVGTAITGVAVIAAVATLAPGLGLAEQQPGVAGIQTSDFEAVPGVPRGEEAAGQKITREEAVRRCALRYPDQKNQLEGRGTVAAGSTLMYEVRTGEKFATCTVPGGDKPSAALVAAAAKDPLPATTAGKLRNCSVQLWVDLTGWRLVASDQSKPLGTTMLVAISPSGRKSVACELQPEGLGGPGASPFLTLNALGPNDPITSEAKPADLFVAGGGGGSFCPRTKCSDRYNYTGWGRVSTTATKVRLELGPGPVHEVPVTEGWFAFTWLSPGPDNKVKDPRLTAYNAAGKVVKVIR